jgi:hypothetical protein
MNLKSIFEDDYITDYLIITGQRATAHVLSNKVVHKNISFGKKERKKEYVKLKRNRSF